MEDKNLIYAGFWKRFLAYLVDELIMSFISFFFILPFMFIIGIGIFSNMDFDKWENYSSYTNVNFLFDKDISAAEITLLIAGALILALILTVIRWLYFALMESSKNQGTLGKMILNLKVTDLNGNRVTFGRATGRTFGKFLSGLILNIGYIMAAFTDKKQALHDILAGCLVIDDSPEKKYLQQQYKSHESI